MRMRLAALDVRHYGLPAYDREDGLGNVPRPRLKKIKMPVRLPNSLLAHMESPRLCRRRVPRRTARTLSTTASVRRGFRVLCDAGPAPPPRPFRSTRDGSGSTTPVPATISLGCTAIVAALVDLSTNDGDALVASASVHSRGEVGFVGAIHWRADINRPATTS